ncbi:MAG: hypothetical protein EOL92_07185, partial [Bacteroidia bacterium]|nr:hypothetical protein [Bacteroidia bacterium]
PADICLYGGAAGSGKSYALLLDALAQCINYPSHMAGIVRREATMMDKPGAVVDTCAGMIRFIPEARMVKSPRPCVTFDNNSKILFFGMKNEADVDSIHGAQMNYIGVDEATQMTKRQIMYLLSRNRGLNGAPCMLRMTCNPDPESFLREWVDWYLDPEGFPIKAKSGILRYFAQSKGETIWGNNRDEVAKKANLDPHLVLSFSFIPADITDNVDLMRRDKGYLASLEGQSEVDRMRLRYGNWNIKETAGQYFKPHYFKIIDRKEMPELIAVTRGWDLASSEGSGDHTASIKMGRDAHNNFYIMDMDFVQYSPFKVDELMMARAKEDGNECVVRVPQDPGQAGRAQMAHIRRNLVGYVVRSRAMTTAKESRARPMSSAAEQGLIHIIRAPWNETFLAHAEAFPPVFNSPDIIDAAVEAFEELTTNVDTESNIADAAPISLGDNNTFHRSDFFTFGGVDNWQR